MSTNLKDLLSNIDNLERSFKTKVMKPAIRIAGQIVAKQAASNVKAVASRTSYAGGTPGNSRTTGTRDKWSQSTAAKRASGNHSDLSKSIKVKSLNVLRRKNSPVVAIVGPDHKMFGFGHMLEFGSGGYEKPSAHYLWSKEKDPAKNDIDKIRAMPFLEPAGKQTAAAQFQAVAAYVNANWTSA